MEHHATMKLQSFVLSCLLALATWPVAAQRPARTERQVPPELTERVKQFFGAKEAQARKLAEDENQPQVPEIWDFFAAGKSGDWAGVSDLYRNLRRGAYQYEGGKKDKRLETMVWQTVNEAFGCFEECAGGAGEYVEMFGQEILDAMPRGSIYFGGTDPGRWLVTLFSKSHAAADPCFVLTQNALADGLYLKYLRIMYGDRIAIPSADDSKAAFDEYLADAEKRLDEGKLKPGENVSKNGGKTQVSGQVAVMEINARLARHIFDTNPTREFYVEESFPLDWMYPHLSPRGLIMKIERTPPKELPVSILNKDRDYWAHFTGSALGPWLGPETKVQTVCDFATKVFVDRDRKDFKGDAKFVENGPACRTYSKLRSSIAGVYAWRMRHSQSPAEKERMTREADLAFKQAFALCPYSPEAVFRYTSLLVEVGRKSDALLIAKTGERADPRNRELGRLVTQLEDKQDEK
jgi:hypothetical protein